MLLVRSYKLASYPNGLFAKMASLGDDHVEQSDLDSEGEQDLDGGSFENLPEEVLESQGDQGTVQSSTQSLAAEQVKITDNVVGDDDDEVVPPHDSDS